MKNQAIQINIKGNTIYVKAYINFKGDANVKFGNTGKSYADIITEGIKEKWTTTITGSEYDFVKGIKGDVVIDIVSMIPGQKYFTNPDQKYLQIDFNSSNPAPIIGWIGKEITGDSDWAHISHREGSGESWSISNPGNIDLFNNYYGDAYSETDIKAVAAHEFGHAMGIGDAYPEANGGNKLKNNAEISDGQWAISGDIMWHNGAVSSNDIEMVLKAYETNNWQYFMNYDGHKKSDVIKLKQEFIK